MTAYKRPLIAINPSSGGGMGTKLLQRFEREGRDLKITLEIIDLFKQAPSPQQLAACDLFIIAGGDGTVSRLINHLKGCSVPIFILPLGTGNDLAREFGIKSDLIKLPLNELLKLLEDLKEHPLQCWDFNCPGLNHGPITFCNYISFGFDGMVVDTFHKIRASPRYLLRKFGPWGNRLAYAASGLYHLLYPRILGRSSVSVTIDDLQRFECLSLCFANIRCITGLGLSNQVGDPGDQLLEGLKLSYPWHYLALASGKFIYGFYPQLLDSKAGWNFELLKSASLQIDGEPGSSLGLDTVTGRCSISPGPKLRILA